MASKTTTINVRTSPATKKEAVRVFDKLGLDLSAGIHIYLARIARDQAVPFQLYAGNHAARCPTCGHLRLDRGREARGEAKDEIGKNGSIKEDRKK